MREGTRVLVVDTLYSGSTGTVHDFNFRAGMYEVELDGSVCGLTLLHANELQVIEEGEDK